LNLIFKKLEDFFKTIEEKKKSKALGSNPSENNKELLKETLKLHVNTEEMIKRNIEKAYSLAWGQCSISLRA